MSDNKKYYYLKLKDNFFETDEMIVLESMPDGYKYSNILLKLYLRSLRNDGKLMFNDRIPYNSTILSQVTRHSVGDVEKAISVFNNLNLIEVLDNGAIYITDIQNFIGTSSTEADRKREYRKRIEMDKVGLLSSGQTADKCPDKNPPEIEIDIELDLEKDIKQPISELSNVTVTSSNATEEEKKRIEEEKKRLNNNTVNKLTESELKSDFDKLWNLYPNKKGKAKAFTAYKKAIKDGVTNEDIQTGIVAYSKEIGIKRTEPSFIAHGSTWFNNQRWEDDYETDSKDDMSWLDPFD